MDPRILGAQLNSALYLAFVAWVGIATAHPRATYTAIAAMGVTYLSYIVQLGAPAPTTLEWFCRTTIVVISIALGAAAGILLLV